MHRRSSLPHATTTLAPLEGNDMQRDAEGMLRVREEYGKLKTVVSTLNHKMSSVLAKQESEFLAAYRAHMYNVQKDLAALRQKVADAENALQKNERVQKLEEDCEWYRSEAIRLDGFATAMKKDLKYMKDKLDVLEEERAWYAKQLKAAKRHTRLLLAELEMRSRGGSDPGSSQQGSQRHESHDEFSAGPQTAPPAFHGLEFNVKHLTRVHPDNHIDVGYSHGGRGGRATKTSTGSNRSAQPRISQAAYEWNQSAQEEEINGREQSQEQEQCIAKHTEAKKTRPLRQQLNEERKISAQLRASLVGSQLKRSELEGFFLQAVEDVKQEIERRRRRSTKNDIGSRSPPKPTSTVGSSGITSPSKGSPARSEARPSTEGSEDMHGGPAVDLDDFTSNDRVDVITRVLAEPGVLEALRAEVLRSSEPAHEHDDSLPSRVRMTARGASLGGEASGMDGRYGDGAVVKQQIVENGSSLQTGAGEKLVLNRSTLDFLQAKTETITPARRSSAT